MPVLEAVQTFAGIANENEFYSHHYLAEVFKGDIKARLETWEATEAAHPGNEAHRAPNKRLQAWAQRWFALRSQISRARDDAERWQLFSQIQTGLLQALGYAAPAKLPTPHELVPGSPVPLWHLQLPQLAVIPAYRPGAENEDLLDHALASLHYGGEPVPKALQGETWAELLSDAVFGADAAPRYVLLVGLDQWLLLDRYKWPNNRALRFDWSDILDRKDTDTLKATAALLHKTSLAPGEGNSLLESLDENAHRHAFGVSEDLKYALREAIELLGFEAARQLDEQASGSKKSVYSGQYKLNPAELSLECLRMVYRLLFMFYIEARPELGYVPISKSEVYLKGYSLESLRELEMRPLSTPQARDGLFFDATLRRLFKLVAGGCGMTDQHGIRDAALGAKDTFSMAPLDSRLFDDTTMPLLGKVKFPNHIWQRIIRLMSLTRGKGRGQRSGRVSYQLLSINQLVEWNESGVLGERNPVFAVRKISASDLAKLRAEAFNSFPGLKADWTDELQEAEGTQNFLNAVQNYPLLEGMKANLYKCVKFRLFINTLEEQFWFFHTPGFECINRRKMAESALRDVVVVGQQVVVQSGLQLGA